LQGCNELENHPSSQTQRNRPFCVQGRYIYFDDDNSDGWFFRSDHYNFVKQGVPAVVLENGQHPVDMSKPNKYPMPVWYHKPSDEYHEDWDVSGTLANVNLLLSVALSLAN
jgi:Zn-dependent M28 family amino/carboxypeptidase